MRGDVDFQKRHFEFLADTIRNGFAADPDTRVKVAREFADRLRSTNHKFDPVRFLVACGAM